MSIVLPCPGPNEQNIVHACGGNGQGAFDIADRSHLYSLPTVCPAGRPFVFCLDAWPDRI